MRHLNKALLMSTHVFVDKLEKYQYFRARDKGSIHVKYPYVLSKYSIIFKNLGIDTQLIFWQSTQLFPN